MTSIHQFTVQGHLVYVVKMESGSMRTGINTEALLAKYPCDVLLSTGVVGALVNNLEIGEWLKITKVVAWQKGSYTQGGFNLDSKATLLVENSEISTAIPAIWEGLRSASSASGDAFIGSDNFRDELASTTGSSTVDMNLYGMLSAVNNHRLNSYHFRVVSDLADDNASSDFSRFVNDYDGVGGKAAYEWISRLADDLTSPQSHNHLQRILKLKEIE